MSASEAKRALLSRFHAEHEDLRRMLDTLVTRIHELAVDTDGGASAALARTEVQWLIGELEERLPRHFADVESAGFLSLAIDQAPRLSRRAEVLRDESRALARWLSLLGERMRSAGSLKKRWQKLDIDCHRFAEIFHEHEYSENALICEAWVDDIGAVD
jgi:hypothetical protein